jgi:hypothetical protein
MKELHPPDRITGREAAIHAPVEERFQYAQILVDRAALDGFCPPQFDVLNLGRCYACEELLRIQLPLPHLQDRLDVARV